MTTMAVILIVVLIVIGLYYLYKEFKGLNKQEW